MSSSSSKRRFKEDDDLNVDNDVKQPEQKYKIRRRLNTDYDNDDAESKLTSSTLLTTSPVVSLTDFRNYKLDNPKITQLVCQLIMSSDIIGDESKDISSRIIIDNSTGAGNDDIDEKRMNNLFKVINCMQATKGWIIDPEDKADLFYMGAKEPLLKLQRQGFFDDLDTWRKLQAMLNPEFDLDKFEAFLTDDLKEYDQDMLDYYIADSALKYIEDYLDVYDDHDDKENQDPNNPTSSNDNINQEANNILHNFYLKRSKLINQGANHALSTYWLANFLGTGLYRITLEDIDKIKKVDRKLFPIFDLIEGILEEFSQD